MSPEPEPVNPPIEATRLALVVAGVLLIVPRPVNAVHLELLIAIAALLIIGAWRDVLRPALLVLVVGGIALRIASIDQPGSDVLRVTEAAVQRMLAGGNPYGSGYEESIPPGAPFPYGPVALWWYVPAGSALQVMEIASATVVAVILGLQGRIVGLAVYSSMAVLIQLSVDGSNDTSLGLLILVAFMAARQRPLVGAAILAVAVGFKLSALAFVPLFVAWAGLRAGGVFVLTSLLAWAPVLTAWGVGSFLRSAQMANNLHSVTVWSLGKLVQDITGERLAILDQLRYVFGGVLALVTLPFRRSLDHVILIGAAIYMVTLYGGNWSTFAYFAGLAPVICWRLDDWLALTSNERAAAGPMPPEAVVPTTNAAPATD